MQTLSHQGNPVTFMRLLIVLSLISGAFTFTAGSRLIIVNSENSGYPQQPRLYRESTVKPIERRAKTRLFMIDDEDSGSSDNPSPSVDLQKNPNAQSFQGYLGPYVVAAVCSLLATGAFVKFVLLDY